MAEKEKRQASSQSLIARTDELNETMQQISYFEAVDEEVPDELKDKLTNALTAHSEKVDRCIIWVNRAKSEIDWLKQEKKSVDGQIKRVESSITRMNALAEMVMDRSGEARLSGMHHYFLKAKSTAVKITDSALIPDKYKETVATVKVDVSGILSDLRAGLKVPGAELEHRTKVQAK